MTQTGQQQSTGYAPANGVGIYWESRGSGGTPLVLLHGGYGLASMFDPLAGQFAAERQVVALELQGHGHTADIARPFSWDDFGDDVAAVLAHLGLGRVDLLGYSLGGGAALRCAIRHPEAVRKLVVVSAPCRRSAWFPEVIAGFDQMSGATLFDLLRQSPLYAQWQQVAPDPASFPALIDKTGALLRQPYDWAARSGSWACRSCSSTGTATASRRRTPPSSMRCSAAGSATPAGTAACRPRPGWPSCPAARTTTSLDSPLLPAIIAEFTGPPADSVVAAQVGIGADQAQPQQADIDGKLGRGPRAATGPVHRAARPAARAALGGPLRSGGPAGQLPERHRRLHRAELGGIGGLDVHHQRGDVVAAARVIGRRDEGPGRPLRVGGGEQRCRAPRPAAPRTGRPSRSGTGRRRSRAAASDRSPGRCRRRGRG